MAKYSWWIAELVNADLTYWSELFSSAIKPFKFETISALIPISDSPFRWGVESAFLCDQHCLFFLVMCSSCAHWCVRKKSLENIVRSCVCVFLFLIALHSALKDNGFFLYLVFSLILVPVQILISDQLTTHLWFLACYLDETTVIFCFSELCVLWAALTNSTKNTTTIATLLIFKSFSADLPCHAWLTVAVSKSTACRFCYLINHKCLLLQLNVRPGYNDTQHEPVFIV